jgi:hypothetical protein
VDSREHRVNWKLVVITSASPLLVLDLQEYYADFFRFSGSSNSWRSRRYEEWKKLDGKGGKVVQRKSKQDCRDEFPAGF